MAVRIKRHWFQDGKERSPEEQATVIAVAVWKSATHGLQGLRKARFSVDIGDPFIKVLTEFVVFLVTVADRVAYLHEPSVVTNVDIAQAGWRQTFTVALARRLATIYQENLDQLIGPPVSIGTSGQGHRAVFVDLLNRRMAEYADFEYGESGPEFAFLRYFGNCIEAALPDPADRRWVLDQIMVSQAPEAIESVDRGMRGVLGLDPKPQRRREGSAAE